MAAASKDERTSMLEKLDLMVRFWELTARHGAGEPLTPDEQVELLSWMQLITSDLEVPAPGPLARNRGALPAQVIGAGTVAGRRASCGARACAPRDQRQRDSGGCERARSCDRRRSRCRIHHPVCREMGALCKSVLARARRRRHSDAEELRRSDRQSRQSARLVSGLCARRRGAHANGIEPRSDSHVIG